jgi:ComF family protein
MILSALFQELCPACGGCTDRGFCGSCAAEFARVADPCTRCGLEHGAAGCAARGGDWRIAVVRAPLYYRPPLDRHLQALKYRGARRLGRALALLLARELGAAPLDVDALVPVPLHPLRLRERGFNQAVELARPLARELRVPMLLRGMHRRRHAATQTGQGAAERRASVARAFAAERNLDGLRLAVVDDVITTGATVNAMAEALTAAGAREVHAWAIARTPAEVSF